MRKILPLISAIVVCFGLFAAADAGVIIPLEGGQRGPDESKLSLYRMELDVVIDNGYATVKILQVFRNHTARTLEGQFVFVIPSDATISDFAVWDDRVRIPGVVLEKRRAREIYEEIVATMKDPGLLETMDDAAEVHRFKARIFPIPAGGTKRLEMEFTQKLDISMLRSYFTFPLKPALFKPLTAEIFKTNIEIKNNHDLKDFKLYKNNLGLSVEKKDKRNILISGEASKVKLDKNLSLEYVADIEGIQFDFITYRNADRFIYDPDPFHGYKYKDSRGYFYSAATYNLPPTAELNKNKDVVILLDISLSMQWNRLTQAYGALEYFIKNLESGDRFQVILFNDEVKAWEKKILPYSPERAASALKFVRESYLTGGTDLLRALKTGLEQFRDNPHVNEPYVVLISDGHPTFDELRYKEIISSVDKWNREWKPAESKRPYLAHIYVYGIGDKTNSTLLKRLVEKNNGFFTWITDTEDQEFKIRSFLEKIGTDFIEGVKLIFSNPDVVTMVYPEKEESVFDKTSVGFVGVYKKPAKNVNLKLTGKREGKDVSLDTSVDLPEKDLEHPHIPRMWAKARVEKLLDLIRFEGEKREWINEVIALAKQYKFVTPYTSFLAAPRSLLRPRVIKPGDPVLRVRADSAILSVIAQFPFGLIKPMKYIKSEDVWEVRFLAPADMNDGSYSCLLHLRDRDGNIYRENKDFIIDSRSPEIIPEIGDKSFQAGDRVEIIARADRDTRRLMARLADGIPVELRYKTERKASTAWLEIPESLPTGVYDLEFFAEDFAHNHSNKTIQIEVIGR